MSRQHGLKTDLLELKLLAKSLLHMEPEQTEFSPIIVHHPFTTTGIVGLKDAEGNLRIGNIMESPEDRKQWRKQMAEIIDGCDNAFSIYHLIEKQYALGFFKYAAPSLSKADYSAILADAWIRSEQPNHDPNLPQSRLLAMFRAADPKLLMDEQERNRLDGLEDTVTVYRGVRSARSDGISAMSWTLDKDTAVWFANRYGRQGKVYEAKIEKKHIHALFLGRNESEVILDPKYLTDITQVQDLQHSLDILEQTM